VQDERRSYPGQRPAPVVAEVQRARRARQQQGAEEAAAEEPGVDDGAVDGLEGADERTVVVARSPGMIALAYSAKKPAVTPVVIVASTRTVVRTPSMAPSRSPSP
jgi:hypothetical protein